jgi:hypothetical protein
VIGVPNTDRATEREERIAAASFERIASKTLASTIEEVCAVVR